MKKTMIVNAHVISPGVDLRRARIVLKGLKIESVEPMEAACREGCACRKGFDVVVDVRGKYVVPGFIDVHLHGANGSDVCDATPEAIETIAEAKLAEGCTTFLPTTLTIDNKTLKAAARAVAAYMRTMRFSKVPPHFHNPIVWGVFL